MPEGKKGHPLIMKEKEEEEQNKTTRAWEDKGSIENLRSERRCSMDS
jgi:hypothetical protein